MKDFSITPETMIDDNNSSRQLDTGLYNIAFMSESCG